MGHRGWFASGLLLFLTAASPAVATAGDVRVVEAPILREHAPDYAAKWAVVIGIDRYEKRGRLEFAVNDARALRDALIADFNYKRSNIVDLCETVPRGADIRAAFARLTKAPIGEDDSVLVFYAGHGLQNGDLVGADDDIVGLEWVRDAIGRLPCRHKLLILDSCFAGILFRMQPGVVAEGPSPPPASGVGPPAGAAAGRAGRPLPARGPRGLIAGYLREGAFWGLSAARDTPASDGQGEGAHSIFTAAVLEILRERADSTRVDQVFTFRELATRVEAKVRDKLDSDQVPDWGRLGPGSGDFVFRPANWRLTPSEQATRRTYLDGIKSATQAILDSDRSAALGALESQVPTPAVRDLRGFEWHHLRASLGGPVAEYEVGHLTEAIAFSPDGGRLIVGTNGMETGLRPKLEGDAPPKVQILISGLFRHSPDGMSVVLGNGDQVEIRDARKLDEDPFAVPFGHNVIARGTHPGELTGVGFVGDLVVSATRSKKPDTGSVRLWQPRAGRLEPVGNPISMEVHCIDISRSGALLAIASAGEGVLLLTPDELRIAAGEGTRQGAGRPVGDALGRQGWRAARIDAGTQVSRLVFSPDDRRLACLDLQGIRIYSVDPSRPRETRANELATILPRLGPFRSACFSRDGRLVYTGEESRIIRCISYADGLERWNVIAHRGAVQGLALGPDGRLLASHSFQGEVSVWDVERPPGRLAIPADKDAGNPRIRSLHFSPDGRHLAAITDYDAAPERPQAALIDTRQVISVWDSKDGARIGRSIEFGPRRRIDSAVPSQNGRDLIVIPGAVVDLRSGVERLALKGPDGTAIDGAFALAPDGSSLVAIEPAGAEDSRIVRYSLEDGSRESNPRAFGGKAKSLAMSRDGQWLAVAGQVPREGSPCAGPRSIEHYAEVLKIWNLVTPGGPGVYCLDAKPGSSSDTRGLLFDPGDDTLEVLIYLPDDRSYEVRVLGVRDGRLLKSHRLSTPGSFDGASPPSLAGGRVAFLQWGRLKLREVVLDQALLTFPVAERIRDYRMSPVGDSCALAVDGGRVIILRGE